MKLSIVIPAFNEEKELPGCLESVRAAVEKVGTADGELGSWQFETIVADNNSSDATAEIAREAGAEVVFEPVNQISRARNAGASAATGDWLLFIDADSRLHEATLAETLRSIESGRFVAGGCRVALDPSPRWARGMVGVWNLISRTMRWAAGSFLFCRSDAFRELGGFSEGLYAAEEIDLSHRLKKWGRPRGLALVILSAAPHVSSGRKFELYTKSEIFRHCCRSLFRMRHTLHNRQALDFFYDGRR